MAVARQVARAVFADGRTDGRQEGMQGRTDHGPNSLPTTPRHGPRRREQSSSSPLNIRSSSPTTSSHLIIVSFTSPSPTTSSHLAVVSHHILSSRRLQRHPLTSLTPPNTLSLSPTTSSHLVAASHHIPSSRHLQRHPLNILSSSPTTSSHLISSLSPRRLQPHPLISSTFSLSPHSPLFFFRAVPMYALTADKVVSSIHARASSGFIGFIGARLLDHL